MHVAYIGLTGGLARATQANGRWTVDKAGIGPIESIAVDPNLPTRVYACGEQDLWRSDDAGVSWNRIGEGIHHPVKTVVAVSASEQGSDGGVVYVGTRLSAVYRSGDGGRSFRELEAFRSIPSREGWATPPAPDTHHVASMVVDPVGAEGTLVVGLELAGVVRSTDGGETWSDTVPIADPDPHSMLSHADAPGRLYISGGDSYCESDDYGASWTRPVNGLNDVYFDKMAVDPGDPGTMVISAGKEPWTGHALPGYEPWSTLYHRIGGGDWAEVTDGLPPREGTAMGYLGANPAEPGVFYYATHPGGLFRSADAGASWDEQQVDWPDGGHRRVKALLCTEI